MIYVIIVTIVLGIGLAWWYFVPLNNQTGRHYTRKWWFGVLLATFISTAIVSGVLLCLQANSSLSGASELRFKITLVSAFYASALYLFVSVIWWNFLPTNACRFMKFK
jgi:Ni/Fe-hydrogenase subunit HybB-like protein